MALKSSASYSERQSNNLTGYSPSRRHTSFRAKAISRNYDNVHPEIEICLNRNTIVKELEDNVVTMKMSYHFKEYEEIQPDIDTHKPNYISHIL
ncbi:hypothetical protein LIER_05419 [Lithospermum erythrorhizon]|uniref:Uncharacterized protein n=1 Tax=Lithospermum erythrorhizon TaxID=34254 RepID=A0AAV3P2C3_LITER